MRKWTKEELTCPECGFVAKDKRGLNGHRQFKHGVHPSAPQLPLEKQDLLISESKLEQRLNELEYKLGFGEAQQESSLPSALDRLLRSRQEPITERVARQAQQLSTIEEQLKAPTSSSEFRKLVAGLRADLAKLSQEAKDNIASLRYDLNLAFIALSSSEHSDKAKSTISSRVQDAETTVKLVQFIKEVEKKGVKAK